jgi:hypothetical protein
LNINFLDLFLSPAFMWPALHSGQHQETGEKKTAWSVIQIDCASSLEVNVVSLRVLDLDLAGKSAATVRQYLSDLDMR